MKKIVLFGYTKTGREIAKLLKDDEDYDLMIIDENPMQVADANADGFFARHSSFNDDKILHDSGITDDAEILFCASNDDNLNLFVTFSARNLNPNIKILTLIYRKEDEKKMLLAGANRTISPYDVGAIKAFRIIDKPKVSQVLNLFSSLKSKLSMIEIVVLPKSQLDGVFFKDIHISEDIIFLGILDKELGDEFIFFAEGINHKIDAGDTIILLGSKSNIKKYKKTIGVK